MDQRPSADCDGNWDGSCPITNTVRYTAMSPEPFKDVWR
jgi:hypothetical protein